MYNYENGCAYAFAGFRICVRVCFLSGEHVRVRPWQASMFISGCFMCACVFVPGCMFVSVCVLIPSFFIRAFLLACVRVCEFLVSKG